jgi:hypothetical protein
MSAAKAVSFYDKRFLYEYGKKEPPVCITDHKKILPLEHKVGRVMPKSPRRSSVKKKQV